MALFNVTYEIITEESAEEGDAEERGFIARQVPLMLAIRMASDTESSSCSRECVECDEWPVQAPRWITVYNGRDCITGSVENRSLHMPGHLTPSTRRRIARLMGLHVP